jgi:hypothetical protein
LGLIATRKDSCGSGVGLYNDLLIFPAGREEDVMSRSTVIKTRQYQKSTEFSPNLPGLSKSNLYDMPFLFDTKTLKISFSNAITFI